MRNLGMGKKVLEWRIKEEARYLLDVFLSTEGSAFDPKDCVTNAVSNVVTAISFGHKFSYKDELFHRIIDSSNVVGAFFGTTWGQLYDAFPRIMHHLPGPHQTAFKHLQFLKKYLLQEIRQHQQNPSDEPQDFVDYYLQQISKRLEKEKEEDSHLDVEGSFDMPEPGKECDSYFFQDDDDDDDDHIAHEDQPCQALGSVHTFASWGAHLWKTPVQVLQGKVVKVRLDNLTAVYINKQGVKTQKEIDEFVESTENLQYEDRLKMPYTNAVIHEMQRFSNVVPTGLTRLCTTDIELHEYSIKKGSIILANLASANLDPKQWKFPNTFNPSNFLDEEGNFQANEAFVPFSAGNRICMGEQMARTELFIFFTSLLKTFSFHLPQGVTEINMDGILGTTFLPYPYQICALPR
ncbi:cytochrome P450 2J4-like [Leptodactylus fuscus]